MIPQEVQDLIKQKNNAIIAVNRSTGGPHVTPVWYLWDGEAFYLSITKDRAKYPNIKRNPSISLIIDDVAAHKYIAVYGQALFIERDDPNFDNLTSQIVLKYLPPEQAGDFLKMAAAPNRVVIKLQPEKVVAPNRG